MGCNSKKRNKQTFVNIDVLVIDPYFCHQIAWHWMECRTGESVLFDLYTSSPDWCCQPYEVFQCNKNICDFYAKAMFTTESCLLVLTVYRITFTEKQHCHRRFCESTDQGPEQKHWEVCEEYISHRANIGTAPSICFSVTPRLLHPKNIKSIIGLVMSKGNKWNFKSYLYRNYGTEI